jgi:hypothetical protein
MEDIEKILVDNLKDTLKSAQTYLLTGMGAALFLLLLAIQGRFNQPNEDTVGVPFVGLDAPTSAAAFIALGLHLLSGGIVLVLNGNCRRIEETLRKSKAEGLLDAVLTYPSLIRTSKLIGVGAALITFLLGTVALFASWYPRGRALSSLFSAILLSSPYLILAWLLGQERRRSE